MTSVRRDIKSSQALQEAVEEAWRRHNLGTFANAEKVTSVERTGLLRMRTYGLQPSVDTIIKWATGLKEPVNRWLELAGYDPIPAELVCEPGALYYLTSDAIVEQLRERRVPEDTVETVREVLSRTKTEE